MNEKIVINSNKQSNILKVITNYMDSEKIDYIVETDILELSNDIKTVICIDDGNTNFNNLLKNKNISLIVISDSKRIINTNLKVNYIITNLINDETKYTDVQSEYLLKKGIYYILLQKLNELLENENDYNGMIYDLTALKTIPDNWIFTFDSITNTYSWLSKKNKMLPNDFTLKIVNFYNNKVYDDSLREINYLTEKLSSIKEGKYLIDIFVCNKEELELFKKNYFFRLLIKNICPNYKLYLVNKDNLLVKDRDICMKLLDGIIIYNDCVYRDTYGNEFSLGYVDCNEGTLKEYNKYFDYIVNQYGLEIKVESDLNGFSR